MNFPIFFFISIQITILLTYLRSYDDKALVCKSCLAPNEPLWCISRHTRGRAYIRIRLPYPSGLRTLKIVISLPFRFMICESTIRRLWLSCQVILLLCVRCNTFRTVALFFKTATWKVKWYYVKYAIDWT